MSLFKELTAYMAEYNFYPSKKKAQNFLVSDQFLDEIVKAAHLEPSDTVLEVGAGTGFLTRELLKHSKVVASELDEKLCGLLREQFRAELESKKLVLLEGNFLEQKLPKFNKVVSLPPYTISSKLVLELVLEKHVESMVFVLQREFVKKCVSRPGFNDYGPLAVLLGYYFDDKVLEWNLSPENFFPKPNSFSSLVVFSRKQNIKTLNDESKFVFFLKTLFRYKNKKLSNALEKSFPFLKKSMGFSKKGFEKTLEGLKEKDSKVYLLEPEELVSIFQEFLK